MPKQGLRFVSVSQRASRAWAGAFAAQSDTGLLLSLRRAGELCIGPRVQFQKLHLASIPVRARSAAQKGGLKKCPKWGK